MIALESGAGTVRVARIKDGWLDGRMMAFAPLLEPMPMRYFGGRIP